MSDKFTKTALLSVLLMAFTPGAVLGQAIEKKGTTPYVTHFIFRPLMSLEIPGLGTATALEAVGTTQNMKGEKMLDKMSAQCTALNVDRATRNTLTAPACWPTATVTKFSRPSTHATSISRSRKWIAAPISSQAAPASTRGSPGASHLLVTQCLHWLVPAAIPRWTSRITLRGRSNE